MKDIHAIFTKFKQEFPEIQQAHDNLGKQIHEHAGPLPEKTRWLLKIVISAAAQHDRALETHILKAREAGATDEEMKQAMLLLIPTVGFPAFMESYSILEGLG